MEDNSVILPPFVERPSTAPGDVQSMSHTARVEPCRSELKAFDWLLFNKKCNVNYQQDAGSSSTEPASSSLKRPFNTAFDARHHYTAQSDDFPRSKRRSRDRDSSTAAPVTEETLTELISSGDQATMDKIVYLASANAKKIMSLLNNSKSIKQFQTQLQPMMLNMCVDMYRDRPKIEDSVANLKNRVNSLTQEKTMLYNVIKSQYESIKKLKDQEHCYSNLEQEKDALRRELGRLRREMNDAIYKRDPNAENMFTNFINR